ncbi:hypothetical protein Poly30_39780 [Planctomycetes bacterium Poly30]|uniref:Planctomycete cytochrome C n=1 Tax=Saltatorellus ferox TaxID=2528018 RepID=A0A518EWG2_9BACT|nr:hypothetical protein Poly30_39780 [Planctomycetes bacterium Poly30]
MALYVFLALAVASPPAQESTILDFRELTELVCLDCHTGSGSPGASAAERIDLGAALESPEQQLELLTTAFAQVRQGFMPPSDTPGGGFDDEERAQWIAGVRALAKSIEPDPGHATLRRMTRRQIARTLKQLFGLDVPVERFLPRDASGYGFDTTGDTLFVTPLYYESWYECVEYVVEALRTQDGELPSVNANSVRDFLRLAFSREATDAEVEDRVKLALEDEGEGWLDVVRATLLSQEFLYRVEGEGAADAATVSTERADGYTLAARLSFFLHGTRPDAALLARASAGELKQDETLAGAVESLLDDRRSRSLAEDFATQWLGTSELSDVTPDVRRYSGFNEGLREAMGLEVIEFFDDLVRANRSALECLDSEFVFVNRRLARHYGMQDADHQGFRRVPRETDARGGVLGMAGVLTVTSHPLRTSPVKRGQWVLERIFHAPAPPPPPNAGTLPEDDQQEDKLSLAARLAAHRASPACSACHDQMDPWGLALERYDGIGQWREPEKGEPEKAAPEKEDEEEVGLPGATLPDGRVLSGPQDLKSALAADPERFLEAFASALFTYAVGRPPTLVDLIEIDEAVRACIEDEYRARTLLRGVALCRAMTARN